MPNSRLSTADLKPALPARMIERRIYVIRGQKVMLDADLADLYDVETRVLNQAVRRNIKRFPEDFAFELTADEASALRSQIVTLDKGRGRYSKYSPLAFTEHGVAMLSSVLKSERAVQMNIFIIRAFVKLRELMATHKDMAERIEQIERNQKQHGAILVTLVQDVQRLKNPPVTRAIGFIARSGAKKK